MLISCLYFKVKQPMLTLHFVSDIHEHTKKKRKREALFTQLFRYNLQSVNLVENLSVENP